MSKLFLLVLTTILGLVLSIPIDYEELSTSDISSSSDDEVPVITAFIDSKSSADEFIDASDIVKREVEQVSTEKQFALAEIISNIEGSLLSSALKASDVYKDVAESRQQAEDKSDEATTSTTTTERQKRETADKEGKGDSTEDAESLTNSTSTTILSHLVAHDVPVSEDNPAHVVLNHLAIFVPEAEHLQPVLPSFGLSINGGKHEAIIEFENKTYGAAGSSEEDDTDDVEDDEITTISDAEEKEFGSNSTSSTAATLIVSLSDESTTIKTKVIELKEVEEELKEKVAEVEADPIILTARV